MKTNKLVVLFFQSILLVSCEKNMIQPFSELLIEKGSSNRDLETGILVPDSISYYYSYENKNFPSTTFRYNNLNKLSEVNIYGLYAVLGGAKAKLNSISKVEYDKKGRPCKLLKYSIKGFYDNSFTLNSTQINSYQEDNRIESFEISYTNPINKSYNTNFEYKNSKLESVSGDNTVTTFTIVENKIQAITTEKNSNAQTIREVRTYDFSTPNPFKNVENPPNLLLNTYNHQNFSGYFPMTGPNEFEKLFGRYLESSREAFDSNNNLISRRTIKVLELNKYGFPVKLSRILTSYLNNKETATETIYFIHYISNRKESNLSH